MKYIKNILQVIILVLGFVLQCETFHNELYNFDTGFFYSSTITTHQMSDRNDMLSRLKKVAEQNNVHVFATDIKFINNLHEEMYVFADETIFEMMTKEFDICNKSYQSLLSGKVDIYFVDFAMLMSDEYQYTNSFSFYGEKEDIYKVFEEMNLDYEMTFPDIIGSNEKDMIYIVWSFISLLLVLMTAIEAMSRKKEVVVRITMGQSVNKMIVKDLTKEIVCDFAIFVTTRFVVFHILTGEYLRTDIFVIYLLGIVLSSLCYCSYGIYDIKKSFSNVNDSKILLYLNYALKFIMTAVCILVIVTNLSTLKLGQAMVNEKNVIGLYGNHSFLTLREKKINISESLMQDDDNVSRIYRAIYTDFYEKAKPVICENVLEDDEQKITYICINEYGKDIFDSVMGDISFDETLEAVIFVPEKFCDDSIYADAVDCINLLVDKVETIRIGLMGYKENRLITYVDDMAPYGMKTAKNPVIIYLPYNGAEHIDNLCLDIDMNDIMFCLSDDDIEEIKATYDLEKLGIEIHRSEVAEMFEYHKNIIRKIMGFCSSLCVFMFLLQIVLILNINRMEYKQNAMEMAIKKILGYSVFRKNARIVWTSIASSGISMFVLGAIGVWFDLYLMIDCIKVSFVILSVEMMVILINIYIIEKKNIQKILKGGCL